MARLESCIRSLKVIQWQRYGHQLISKTSYYLGPNGTVAQITNGMNCQNCHLSGGTVPWGNNYGARVCNLSKISCKKWWIGNDTKRVNDCLQRSLNGEPIDSNSSKEMKAIIAYMKWLGDGIKKAIPKEAVSWIFLISIVLLIRNKENSFYK